MTDLKSVSVSKNNLFVIVKAAHSVAFLLVGVPMTLKDYKTVQTEAYDEFTEKRSRFIGYCLPVSTEKQAIDFINSKRSEHWDATHNVYAYSLREGNIKRYSDDGEPSGTAGMPVLDVITKNEIYDVCIVVTRYFGGVLLGTGGLVRAYSQGAKVALEAAKPVLMQCCLSCVLECSYNQYGKVSSVIIESGGKIDDTSYGVNVNIALHIPPSDLDKLNKALSDATAGEVKAEVIEEKYFSAQIS